MNGARVYISSRDAKSCEKACEELNAIGPPPPPPPLPLLTSNSTRETGPGTAHAIPADFYKLEDCKRLVEELSKREKKLHILVNNSGSNWGESYDAYPDHAWTRVLTLNLHRVFTITQLCTPLLEAAAVPGDGDKNVGDPARIINIGSVDGMTVPALETFAYSASKAGLHHMSEVLAHHLGKRNITCVSPLATASDYSC